MEKKMKAAVLIAPNQPLAIEQLQISKPGPHEVLIRTAACGLCHSDLHFIEGTYPHPLPAVPGHEAAGIVEAVGSEVRTVKVGDAVVTCLSAFCGHCEYCVTGRMSLCLGAETRRAAGSESRLSRPDGSPVNQMLNLSAFAEMMLIHEHACTAIDPEMPLDRASVIGCAVTTGAGTIFNACKLTPGETVAVVGCGGGGQEHKGQRGEPPHPGPPPPGGREARDGGCCERGPVGLGHQRLPRKARSASRSSGCMAATVSRCDCASPPCQRIASSSDRARPSCMNSL